jgi:uncharacterized protein YdhG (YjbR/CyaY superfamily)
MRTVKSSARRTGAKGKGAPKNVDEYIAAAPQPARARLQQIRAAIRSAVPSDAIETISYGMPAFRNKRVLVWFGAFSDHCSLFPTAAVINAFQSELKSFSTSKGTIHFAMDKPLPTALIKKVVKARVTQSAAGKIYSRRKT